MDSTQANQSVPPTYEPLPVSPFPSVQSPDRVRELLGWRLLQQNWHPGR